MALPNAIFCYFLSEYLYQGEFPDTTETVDRAKNATQMLAVFSSVMFFVLYFRSNVAYSRWWEGGTLLQKTRGEWFNSYSSLIAFSSNDPKMAGKVEEFHHLLARLMSLLFCAALQQCSPNKERAFEVMSPYGIEKQSLDFLASSNDKVEVILQWIQRSTIINMQTGVLPIAPPVMSRAFQEISRGIVNLQNARKIADFPFPFPYAQMSMVMLGIHYVSCPIFASMMTQRDIAPIISFLIVFFLWCINFIALQLEYPFGERDNDLPMVQFQRDWNKSIATLLHHRAQKPPRFNMEPIHRTLELQMSDGNPASNKRISLAYSDLTMIDETNKASREKAEKQPRNYMDSDRQRKTITHTVDLDKDQWMSHQLRRSEISAMPTDVPSYGEQHTHTSELEMSSLGPSLTPSLTDWDEKGSAHGSPLQSLRRSMCSQSSLKLAEILCETRRLNSSEADMSSFSSREGIRPGHQRSRCNSVVQSRHSKEDAVIASSRKSEAISSRSADFPSEKEDCETVLIQPPLGIKASRKSAIQVTPELSPMPDILENASQEGSSDRDEASLRVSRGGNENVSGSFTTFRIPDSKQTSNLLMEL